MALGYISIAVFLLGSVALIFAALLLAGPVSAVARKTWQRVGLSYLAASFLAFLMWRGAVWSGATWVAISIALIFLLPIAGLFSDLRKIAGTQQPTFKQLLVGNFSRSLILISLCILTAILFGRIAVEIGITTSMPTFYRTATQYDFVIEFEGQDYPARFVYVDEKTLHVWTRRHEFWPTVMPFAPGLQYEYPKISANLPFDIYMTSSARIYKELGSLYTALPPHALGNIALVYCPQTSTKCFKDRPLAKETKYAEYGTQLSGRMSSTLFFKSEIPKTENQGSKEFVFKFKNIRARRIDAGPFAKLKEGGNIWLSTAWDWFPSDHKRKCNNIGFLGEWRLCNISNETWKEIRLNQAKLKQTDQSTID